MQNLWIFYSLAGLLALWLWDYIKKLVLSRWWNKELFLLVCFLLYVPIFLINMLFQGTGNYDIWLIKSAVFLWLTDFCIPLGMLTTLKYLNVSFALVSVRLISSFIILFIGTQLFWDNLSISNIVWFLLWAISIFLLSWVSIKDIWAMHKKWFIALSITILWIIISNSYFKYIVSDINIHDFMALKFSVSFFAISMYIFLRKKYQNFTLHDFRNILPFAGITTIIFVVHFLYLLPNIYLLWPLSLSYKILSYSLLVPIILSVIFLGEKLDQKKTIALVLTIISITLFI